MNRQFSFLLICFTLQIVRTIGQIDVQGCDDPNAEKVKCPNPCSGGTCTQPEFAVCDIQCKDEGCQCKSGFVLDTDGKCIRPSQCPKPCGTNEIWERCPVYCTFDDTCEKLLFGIIPDCPAPPEDWQCTEGRCQCTGGMVRIGTNCMERSGCCSDPNAEFVECPNPCPGGTCDQNEFSPCRAPCNQWGCQCKKGYVKDKNGKCILITSCPKPCGSNEVWNPCPKWCTFDDTCEKLENGWVWECTTPAPDSNCIGRCECAPGHVRINRTCVMPSACCSDPNAEFVQCPNPCPGRTCEQPVNSRCNEKCKPWGCQCKPGYVKDKDGKCIRLTSCPQKCNANEVWNPCPKYCTFDATCESYMFGWIRDCTRPPASWQCTGRCECTSGFVRINGKCVNPTACCTDPNAELTKCPNPCPGGTCVQPEFTKCNTTCTPFGCQCKKGYVKNINGMCILRTQCPKCGTNEFFDCGSACDTTCATLGDTCPIVNIKCVEKCYCVQGYARNNRNVCVPIKDCPPRFSCAPNEQYVACPLPCPPDRTCDVVFSGIEPKCPSPTPSPICKPTCRCNSGFARNKQNKCVLPAGCCTDPNSQLVNNPNCCPGGTCASPSFVPCLMKCPIKGCQCKPGFLMRNSTDSTCINRNTCPVTSRPRV